MNFSWLDYEIGKLFREACILEAYYHRLTQRRNILAKHRIRFMATGRTRIGEWLEMRGRDLQGLPYNENNELGSQGASYE
jgi:hypothetical protein